MKCNRCGIDLPYGGYGVCSDCYLILNDIKETKSKLTQWEQKGYGSLEKCIDYMILELNKFKNEHR